MNDEVAQIEEQIADLKSKLRGLNDPAQRRAARASADVNEFVADTIETIIDRVRDKTGVVPNEVAARAAKAGSAAFDRIVEEVEHHPLATLAVAAGIGFLLASARR
jgi:ElaB/YqjD/DUF883 family membrane-anchored ribosome-binding protein